MKIDKSVHAPGSIMLLELQGQIHEAVIVGWSPMGQAVKIMAGQAQMWLATPKAHAIEFLRIKSWKEYEATVEEFRRQQAEAEAKKAHEGGEGADAEPRA